jgi:chemotaxis protein methyltransferase CheR
MLPDASRFDIKILATDIDPQVIATARAGTYSLASTAPIDHDLRERFLFPDRRTETEKNLVVSQDVRSLVAFRELNLIADWPMKGPFDVIFCRNVVIYFEDETREAIWRKMAKIIAPGGHLYIGHSERISNPRTEFVIAGNTIYRLPEGAQTARGQRLDAQNAREHGEEG